MADRKIVYAGSIPLETDILSTNKFAMIGLAKLAAAMMGSNTYFNGLACTPTSPASLSVNIAAGEIYSLQNIDNTAYSSLSADTTHAILKQGILMDAVSLTMTAPVTAGMSVNYLVQIAYQDTDIDPEILPYYNSSNPTQAWAGPNNSGSTQNTIRSGVCVVALKAGVMATTGTQVTPSADTGYTGAYVITVANGQTTITSANISYAANAPFLPSNGIVNGIQSGKLLYAVDTGTANTYITSYLPAITTLTDGVKVVFKAKTANTSTCTFSPNGLTSYPIYSHANQPLQGGEIVANGLIEVEWNSTLTAWVLCGNSGGATPVLAATKPNQAPQLQQVLQISNNFSEIAAAGPTAQAAALINLGSSDGTLKGRLIGPPKIFTASGTYTPTIGTNYTLVCVQGAGSGGSGAPATSSGQMGGGSGGGGGGYAESFLTSGFNGATVLVGSGGSGGTAAPSAGTAGGSSSFGSLLSASGGNPGVANSAISSGSITLGIGGTGGVGATGNIINSQGGSGGIVILNTSGNSVGGAGGDSHFSHGIKGSGPNVAGVSGVFGAGGSGAVQGGAAGGVAGGGGGGGLVIIWEFA